MRWTGIDSDQEISDVGNERVAGGPRAKGRASEALGGA
jgi:hypothetical protein